MASDPDKPLLRLVPLPARDRPVGRPRPIPRPEAFSPDRQRAAFSPKFDRLAELLTRDPSGLELRSDPAALAPERLLVFEVRGAIGPFAAAVRRVPGLEMVDEEELEADGDKAPVAYLMIPDLRALLSPAETVNGLTIGASNEDAVDAADRATARVNVDPYGERRICNPSSALGPGFALSVKPDVLLPGSREMLRVVDTTPHVLVAPARPMRAAGLRVAAPPRDGLENRDGYTNGTSAAAALASRTAHRIHDALELAYGSEFLALPHARRAVLLKALLAHTAKWPDATAGLIRDVIGPPDGRQHVRQKDNIRRFIGFGIIEPEDAVACAADRATFWATGVLEPDKVATIEVPVPLSMGGQARPHAFIATLAWFTPTAPGRRSYRSVRLRLLEPDALDELGVRADGDQPDGNQTNRGTLYMRRWTGRRAAAVTAAASVTIIVQRDPDQGQAIDEPVPFGLAVTLSMPGEVRLYEQVRARLGLVVRAPG